MAKVLITSGPTREYLDPVRYLTNASSGRMGRALADAFLAAGHEVYVVSGPVEITYPSGCVVRSVVTTTEMLEAAVEWFAQCDGVIGAAAPCDFRPASLATDKIAKNGGDLFLQLVETPDILATLAEKRQGQWIVGFALETRDGPDKAIGKMRRKHCDMMILNYADAIQSERTHITAFASTGEILGSFAGSKVEAASEICEWIARHLMR